jgi:hypothetical protein
MMNEVAKAKLTMEIATLLTTDYASFTNPLLKTSNKNK